jgi:hypothetical protein
VKSSSLQIALPAESLETENPNPSSSAESLASPSTLAPNPFANLDAMRLPQDFVTDARVKKLLTTVPVRKPSQQDFFRVHPDPAYQLPAAAIIELKDDREIYFVHPTIVPEAGCEWRAAMIVTTINRQGVLSLWPLKLPSPDGRKEEWLRSALEAAERAMGRWIRIRANMSLGAYEIFEAEAKMPEPEWPDIPFPEILHIAFRDRLIDNVNHAVLKRLRGAS